jgi:hypothetical protein
MNFRPLIGQPLKSDDVIELLEHFDMPVVYDFDRLHEGADDVYWSEAKAEGFQFRFDQQQRLDVVFLYVRPRHGFSAIDTSDLDVLVFESPQAARAEFERSGATIKAGDGWIKALSGNTWTHYEFRDEALSMITISAVTP